MSRSKKVLYSILVLLAVCAAAGILAFRLADHSLTAAGARRLPAPDAGYLWLSNTQLLTFTLKDGGDIPPTGDIYNGPFGQPGIAAAQVDVTSGIQTPLSEFEACFARARPIDCSRWSISPDGKKLMIETAESYGESYPYTVWSLAGHQAEAVDDSIYAGVTMQTQQAFWLPDGVYGVIARPDSGPFYTLTNMQQPGDSTTAIKLPDGYRAVGVTPSKHLICACLADLGGTTILDQPLTPNAPAGRLFTPNVPPHASVQEIALAPQGDRLAWTITMQTSSPLYLLLKKLLGDRYGGKPPLPVTAIYVSGIDGKELRLIGLEPSPPEHPTERIFNVRWRPDGKYLSFRWRRGIYEVPAD